MTLYYNKIKSMKRIMTAVTVLLLCLTATTVSAQGGYQVKGVVVDA